MSALEQGDLVAPMELLWRCDLCGHQSWMAKHPARCNGCGTLEAPMTGMTAVEWRASLVGGKTGGVKHDN